MKMILVSIYDKAVETYSKPITMRARGEAIRTLQDEIANQQQSPIAQHPEDYALFELGTFDDNTGEIEQHASPINLANAHELVTLRNNIDVPQDEQH
jgi:hypothetical protein